MIHADTVWFDGKGELKPFPEGFRQSSAAFSAVTENGIGQGGSVNIITNTLRLTNGGAIIADTIGIGAPGNINVTANRAIFEGVGIDSDFNSSGLYSRVGEDGEIPIGFSASNISLNIGTLRLMNGGIIETRTLGQGNAGNVTISDAELVVIDGLGVSNTTTGILSSVEESAIGNGGTITLNTRVLRLFNTFAAIDASTAGQGDGGLIRFGRTTSRIVVRDGGVISARTTGSGNAGSLQVSAGDSIRVLGLGSRLNFSTSGGGNAGTLQVISPELIVREGGVIEARTDGGGRGGLLQLIASDRVLVEGAGSELNFDSNGSGNAQGLQILTGELRIQDGARVSASASSVGNAGTLNVNATEQVTVEGGNSILSFDTSGSGNAEALNITTPQLTLREGGQVSIGTTGQGSAGLMTVNATESVVVDGNGSRLTSNTGGSGNAGGIEITTGELIVQNRGQVTVSSVREPGYTESLGNAGNLTVTADSIFLDDRGGRDLDDLGGLTAETRATSPNATGGNVILTVRDRILMRNNSLISASARGTANGGNVEIVIPDGFVLASLAEDSDVVASAEAGNGGRASAEAIAVIGFRQFIDRRTPESDFTASSETGLPGIVEIDAEERLPEEIPQFVFEPRITRNCQAIANPNQSEFTITGRGGLPPNAEEAIATDNVQVDLVTPGVPELSGDRTPNSELRPLNAAIPDQIIEAQGWVVGENGDIQLVAAAPQVEPQSPAFAPVNCALLGAVE
jgi:large exoprotein involved in heme utilization and adhesion